MSVTFPPRCAAKYRMVRLISAGAFGTVVEAEQLELGRSVALKFLHLTRQAEAEVTERFLREARVTASLSHPHVIRVLDFDVEDGTPWIAYELLPGGTLTSLVADGPPPWADGCRYLVQVASALEEAHQRGVLHRDVKSQNVLVTEDGTMKLTDFGLAKFDRQEGEGLTRTGAVMGSPAYIAPETLQGVASSAASDVYATGVLLYETLTGEWPFRANTVGALLVQHVRTPVPNASESRPEVPAALDAIVKCAMAKDPGARYATATAFRQALEAELPPEVRERTLSGKVPEPHAQPAPARPGSRSTGRMRAGARSTGAVRSASTSGSAVIPPSTAGAPASASVAQGARNAMWRWALLVPVAGVLLAAGVLGAWRPRTGPDPALASPLLPAASPAPASRAALPEAVHQRMRDLADRITGLRNGRSSIAVMLDSGDGVGSLAGGDPAESIAVKGRVIEFRKVHQSIVELSGPAIDELQSSLGDLWTAAPRDLVPLLDLLSSRAVAAMQVGRIDSLLPIIERGESVNALSLDDRVCYPLDTVKHVYALCDTVAVVLARTAAEPRGCAAVTAQALSELRWVGTYFVHFSFCGLSRQKSHARVADHLLRSTTFPATPAGARFRDLALAMWTLSTSGGTSDARRQLPGVLTMLRELEAGSPDAAEAIAQLTGRLKDSTGERPDASRADR